MHFALLCLEHLWEIMLFSLHLQVNFLLYHPLKYWWRTNSSALYDPFHIIGDWQKSHNSNKNPIGIHVNCIGVFFSLSMETQSARKEVNEVWCLVCADKTSLFSSFLHLFSFSLSSNLRKWIDKAMHILASKATSSIYTFT